MNATCDTCGHRDHPETEAGCQWCPEGYCESPVAETAFNCDVCGLPDPYGGDGDAIGSCDCPRCDGGEAAANSVLCICAPDEDEEDSR